MLCRPCELNGATHLGVYLGVYISAYISAQVFINPSETEVLSTTTAEAVAMGKFAIIREHPSNAFFKRFANVLFYTTSDEFTEKLRYALGSAPAKLTEDESRALSWPGATDRFLAQVHLRRISAVSPTYLGCISALSRLCLRRISAVSRPHLGHISAVSRPYLGYISIAGG